MTKLVAATLAIALLALACGSSEGSVPLLTGVSKLVGDGPGCYTNSATGLLTVDATYGTAVTDEIMLTVTGTMPPPVPVMWRRGFTAHRDGSEVAVTDRNGSVVAVTGHRFIIEGGYAGGDLISPEVPVGVFYACGSVTLLP